MPKVQFDEKPLSKKEADDLLPRMKEIIKNIARYMDKGITATNREHAEAKIWTTLDPEELEDIATILIEAGQQNRIVATAVRRVSNAWKLFNLGLITGPRFLATVNFYKQHGGFALFGGGENVRNERPTPYPANQNRGTAVQS